MPAKDPERRRASVRAWYARTKATRIVPARRGELRVARRQATTEWYRELKAALVCARCGERHPGCLQFHHAEATSKERSVSDAVQRGWSRTRIASEIAKCEVLCANCHAKHHAELERARSGE